jgi:hypothetical protein
MVFADKRRPLSRTGFTGDAEIFASILNCAPGSRNCVISSDLGEIKETPAIEFVFLLKNECTYAQSK